MKQFICLLLFYACVFSRNPDPFTTDYFINTVAPDPLLFPVIPENRKSDSTAFTHISANYDYNLPYYESIRAADTLQRMYSIGVHTWNLLFFHKNSRRQLFAAWRQHTLKAHFAPDNDYETSIVFPRHQLVLGGEGMLHQHISLRAIAAADPEFLYHIATDKNIDGIQSFITAFATPGIDLSTSILFRLHLFSGSVFYENRSPFNSTATILNTTNNGKRTLHLTVNENRFGTGIITGKGKHHFSVKGYIGIFDSSMYRFSDNSYSVITEGHGFHASVDYKLRSRFTPEVTFSYDRYQVMLRGFDNINRSFSRLNGTRFSLLKGAVYIRKNHRKSYGAFCTFLSTDNSSGSLELYPFSSWVTLLNLNRYYLTAARSSLQEYGIALRYLRKKVSRYSFNGELALSGAHLETDIRTAEGNLAFGGLLLVKENEKQKTTDKNYILIKAAATYRYQCNRFTPAVSISQILPVEIRKSSRQGSSSTASSNLKKTFFGGFRISVSLSRDIPARQ